METKQTAGIKERIRLLIDPRRDRSKLHKIMDTLVIAICAVNCGADTWEDVKAFGPAKQAWFKSFLELPYQGFRKAAAYTTKTLPLPI